MGRRAKIDYQTRLEIVEKRIKEGISLTQLAIIYKIGQTAVKRTYGYTKNSAQKV